MSLRLGKSRHGLSCVMTTTDNLNSGAKLQNRCDQSPTRSRGMTSCLHFVQLLRGSWDLVIRVIIKVTIVIFNYNSN